MRKVRTFLIVVLLVFGVGISAVAAAPVAATSSLAYVWVRSAPSSGASALYTIYPTAYATLETTGNTSWDGYQTWAEVYLINNPNLRGWVEQGSLVGASQVNNSAVMWQGIAPQARQYFPQQAPQNNAPPFNQPNALANQPPWTPRSQ